MICDGYCVVDTAYNTGIVLMTASNHGTVYMYSSSAAAVLRIHMYQLEDKPRSSTSHDYYTHERNNLYIFAQFEVTSGDIGLREQKV